MRPSRRLSQFLRHPISPQANPGNRNSPEPGFGPGIVSQCSVIQARSPKGQGESFQLAKNAAQTYTTHGLSVGLLLHNPLGTIRQRSSLNHLAGSVHDKSSNGSTARSAKTTTRAGIVRPRAPIGHEAVDGRIAVRIFLLTKIK
jgi:hypothetical protein